MNWKPLVTERRYNRGVLPAPANTYKKNGRTCAVCHGPAFLSLGFPYCFVLFNSPFVSFSEIEKFLLNIFSPIYLKAQHLRRSIPFLWKFNLGDWEFKSPLTRNFHVRSLPAGEVVLYSLRSWISLFRCLRKSRPGQLVSRICPQMFVPNRIDNISQYGQV